MADFYNGRKWVHSVNDLPDGEFYAILEFGSVHIPGDERSRTNPGHGYPAHSQPTTDVVVYETKAAWQEEIRKKQTDKYNRDNWIPVVIRRAKVTTTVTVE